MGFSLVCLPAPFLLYDDDDLAASHLFLLVNKKKRVWTVMMVNDNSILWFKKANTFFLWIIKHNNLDFFIIYSWELRGNVRGVQLHASVDYLKRLHVYSESLCIYCTIQAASQLFFPIQFNSKWFERVSKNMYMFV